MSAKAVIGQLAKSSGQSAARKELAKLLYDTEAWDGNTLAQYLSTIIKSMGFKNL